MEAALRLMMSPRRSLAISRNELRILRRDPSPLILVILVPILTTIIMRNGVGAILAFLGFRGASGADFAVPAEVVTFAFFIPAFIGISYFREAGWATWDRLRASSATSAEIVIGKLLPMLVLGGCQLAIVFAVGTTALNLRIRGSDLGVLLVAVALVVCVVALGMAVVATFRTMQQVNALFNVGAVALAGLGGALMPLAALPVWVRHVAPITPQYWAMRGFNALVLTGGGLGSALLPMAVLLAFSAGFSAIALWKLRFGDRRLSWA